ASRPSDASVDPTEARHSQGAQGTDREPPSRLMSDRQGRKSRSGMEAPHSIETRNKINACMARRRDETKEEDGSAYPAGKRSGKEPLFGGARLAIKSCSDSWFSRSVSAAVRAGPLQMHGLGKARILSPM